MTDEEHALLRAQAAGFLADAIDAGLPRDETEAFSKLFAELSRLRTENAAMREIVRAVTESYEGLGGRKRDVVLCYNDNADELECPWCHGNEDKRAGFVHESDCPVTKARALLAALGS